MSNHSPLPWKAYKNQVRYLSDNGITELAVCNLHKRENMVANAKFIVRACNVHKDLLSGLSWALTYGTFDVAQDNPLHARELDRAQNAIKKAMSEEAP